MSEVKRYMMVSHSDRNGGAMIGRPNGTWVRYSDYAALAEKYGWTCEAVKVLEKRVGELEFGAHGRTADELRDDIREGVEAQSRYVAEITQLREALGEYGHHKPHCKLDPCDCGILQALKESSDE